MKDEILEKVEPLVAKVDTSDLASVLQTMQKCVKRERGAQDPISLLDIEEAHIFADLLISRLLLEIDLNPDILISAPGLLQQIVTIYQHGVKEYWWHA